MDPRYPSNEVVERYQAPDAQPSVVARRQHTYMVARASRIAYLVLGILESLLIIRFVLMLLAANPGAAFTSMIYGLTEPFVSPFYGVFPTPQSHGAVLDLAAVLAMIVYALVVWGIVSLIYALNARRPTQPI
jgi:uncharacterized protein YggT (Ycf19 family)